MSARRLRGAALIIALALLLMLAMLAVTGMRGSIAEWLMAGNEQFRQAASMGAAAGVESAIASIARGDSPAEPLSGESYEASIRYAGDETTLPGSSIGRIVGRHYEVTSTGTSSRLARDEQMQGVMVVGIVTDGVETFRRIGTGLTAEAAP